MTSESVNMVKHWLEEIGCSDYIEQFLDNGYDDMDICKQIGLKDIDAIGIQDLDDRIRLITAIERLKGKNPNSNKPFYFVLENPKSPSFAKSKVLDISKTSSRITENIACNSWACCTTLGSVSSGTSDYTSNCSHNSISLETDLLLRNNSGSLSAPVLMTKEDTPSSKVFPVDGNDETSTKHKVCFKIS